MTQNREKKKLWEKNNPEKLRAYGAKYRGKNREKMRERAKQYREENKEQIRAKKRAKYAADPEKYNRQCRESAKRHPISIWVRHTLYAHKQKGCKVLISSGYLRVLVQYSPECYYCGVKLAFREGKFKRNSATLDRVNNEMVIRKENIRIICRACNTTKYDRTHEEFVRYCREIFFKFDKRRLK